MINKIYKRIHNKYSGLFKFIFYIRYLFLIFLISFAIFLIIPNFFDYEKRLYFINKYLVEKYNLRIKNYENIKFNSFPRPNIEINGAVIISNIDKIIFNSKSLQLFPNLLGIYDYKNFETKKIKFKQNYLNLEFKELNYFKNLNELKNKFIFEDLNISIVKENKILLKIKNVSFSNFGYQKNIIEGKIFGNKFQIKLKNNFQELIFKLLKTGLTVKINLDEQRNNNQISGDVKIKILKSNLKFDFILDNDNLTIENSFFRNKALSFDSKSIIKYNPFFEIYSSFRVKDFDKNIFSKIDLNQILKSKELIKKINSKNFITYKAKKFSKNLIDDLNLNIDFLYGRLVFSKMFTISKNSFNCSGSINLKQEYPVLNFNCSLNSKDKKSLLKSFLINYKFKDEPININIVGSINILNKKIYFKSIKKEKNYEASEEDLKYFKSSFENILFDENFLNIFEIEKIKRFILEIS